MRRGSFSAEVDAFVAETNREIEAYCRGVVLTLLGMILDATPVLRGRLRGDWRTSVGSPNYQIRSVSSDMLIPYANKTGAEWTSVASSLKEIAEAEAMAAVASWDTAQPLYLTNNLPYAYRVEYEGHSRDKAPAGMVRVSIEAMTANMRGGL
jgi:hypothetical protein